MISSDLAAMLEFLAAAAPVSQYSDPVRKLLLQEVMAPDHDVVEHAHMVEQRQILEGAADAERGPRIRLSARDVLAAIEAAGPRSACSGRKCN